MAVLLDLTPLRTSRGYRWLWAGYSLAAVGAQLATVAIGLQVYALTGSSAAVGLVGLCALGPLVVMGLYGGSLVDYHDRRTVGLVAQAVTWCTSIACAAQAWLGNTHVWVLFVLVALWNGAYAVASPARSSIYPRILPIEQLPAANALSVFAMTGSMALGPLLAGFLIDGAGYPVTYTVDVVVSSAALLGLWQLAPVPPEAADAGTTTRAGFRSVLDGLSFLTTRPNVRMTFLVDLAAMILAQPRVLLPAAAALYLGGGARTVGYLYAASAVGGIAAMVLSGPLGRVRRQGLAILASVSGWGIGIAGLGVALWLSRGHTSQPTALAVAAGAMAFAGACDSVSSVFRQTILQAATPDRLRGRLQGVFIVVVAGGPRLGDAIGGFAASHVGEALTALLGGGLCILAVAVLGLTQPGFARYDARHPVP